MNILALDPGTLNCAWVLLVDGAPRRWGVWSGDYAWSQLSVNERSHRIARSVEGLIQMYDVQVVATEQYFHGPKQSGATVYDRGRFDLWVDLAAGHLPRYYIHPVHLKQWVTGYHRASKDEMLDALMEHTRNHFLVPVSYEKDFSQRPTRAVRLDDGIEVRQDLPFADDVLSALRGKRNVAEHVFEAFGLGWMAAICEWIRRGFNTEISTARRDLVERVFKNGNPRPPMFREPHRLPAVMDSE